MEAVSQGILAFLGLYVIIKFIRSIRIVPTQYAYIVERLGNYHNTLGPGFHALIPFVDNVAYIQDLKEQAISVPPQECFTQDNVKVLVGGVIYISVIDPVKASYGITDYFNAARFLVQTTTRSVIGTMELDTTFEEREAINAKVGSVLAEVEDVWGIKVHRYEVKEIDPPQTVQNAMERQMTAERDRRALIAKSEGQMQSMINDSEGQMQEIINHSEGEMQKRINEAEGKASEIQSIASATAKSIREVAAAIKEPNGKEAVNLRLAEEYIKALRSLAREDKRIILPADLSDLSGLLHSLELTVTGEDVSERKKK